MRVLFVISTLRSGGAERVCSLVASEFSKTHEVVLAKFDKDKPFYELDKRVRLINLNQGVNELGVWGNLKKRFGKISALRRLIKDGKFDAVVSFLDSTNLLVIAANTGLKTPIIISEHTSFDAPKKRVFKILKRILYPFANALSVLTETDARHYLKFCKNVHVIHNPVFCKNSDIIEVTKENLVIFVGRLTPLKNCDMFIRVAANLKDTSYKFIIAGEGEQHEYLQNLAKKLGADILFLGNVEHIDGLYARAKILLSTSRIEGLGNTLIEAISFDVARVATKTSGACELITDGYDGLLCESDDVLAMSEAVKNLIQDETNRIKICQNARLRLKEFGLENIYQKWLNLLKAGGVN